jgi:hypothetical protein
VTNANCERPRVTLFRSHVEAQGVAFWVTDGATNFCPLFRVDGPTGHIEVFEPLST